MECPVCQQSLDERASSCPACGAAWGTGAPTIGRAGGDDSVRRLVERALGPQYGLLRVLGRGGMGVVYLARQHGLDRLVAVKVLSPEIAAPESRERFRREARMAAGLTHPSILPLYAFGEAAELAYIVMGYVQGESLADRLRHERRLPVDSARRMLADLAGALDYAHRHGVVHRDIKPANILLEDESDRALLADFGIAKSHVAGGTLTGTGVALGTPQYMSPEQAMGTGDVDERSDIYSLGVVAYEMLAGHPPFSGRTAHELFVRQATEDPPPLSAVAPDVPEDLARTIMRCLARDPSARWPDAHRFCLAVSRSAAEAGVPDEVREVAGFGSWALLWLVGWGLATVRSYAAGGASLILPLVALSVPCGFVLQGWNIRRSGYPAGQVLRVGLWPPKWWGLWWPRALRRPDDVWDDLPRPARAVRVVLSAFFIAAPFLAYAEQQSAASSALGVRAGAVARGIEYALLAASALAIAVVAFRWRRPGQGNDQLARILVGSTVRGTFWRQPQIAPLLRTGGLATEGGVPAGSPHELLRAISEAAERLAGAARAPGCDAIAAARTLLADIQTLDAELETLQRSADPSEVRRVEQRLTVLGDAADDGAQQQMRALLRAQLELLTRLAARSDALSRRRAHLVEQQRSLWRAVHALELDDASSLERSRVADTLRALCASVAERIGQERELDAAPPLPPATIDGDARHRTAG